MSLLATLLCIISNIICYLYTNHFKILKNVGISLSPDYQYVYDESSHTLSITDYDFVSSQTQSRQVHRRNISGFIRWKYR